MSNLTLKKYTEQDRTIWEDVNLNSENSSFLSSIDWIEFQKSFGKNIDQYLIYWNNEIIGNLYIEIYKRRFTKFAYSPYGPVIKITKSLAQSDKSSDKTETWNLEPIYLELKFWMQNYAKANNLNLFRFDPLIPQSERKKLEKLGFKRSLAPAQAIDTWVLNLVGKKEKRLQVTDIEEDEKTNAKDLEPETYLTDEELLALQKKDTRYYMKRGKKLGVNVIKATTEEHVKAFGELMRETTLRKGFGNYSTDYFLKQWKALNKKGMTEIFLAEYKGKYISGALFNYYKDTANYAHGASTSDSELQKLASPYILHWEIMKDAKARGFKKYNFWGVVPKEVGEHNMRGLSDFKMKFNGEMVSYVGAYEIGVNQLKWSINRLYDWWAYRKERY